MDEQSVEGLVSVIIPTYNRCSPLLESLESVRLQTYRPIEILVVDDGSTDDTSAAVKAWAATLSQPEGIECRCFSQDNAGAPSARNRGLLESRGEYIQFLDSDDLLHPQKLEKHVKYMRSNPLVELVYSATASFTETPDWSATPHSGLPRSDDRLLLSFLRGGLWNTISGLYRRSACQAIGPWNEKTPILQDWEYNVRFILGDPFVGYLDSSPLSLCRLGLDHRVTGTRLSEKSVGGRYELARTWIRWIRRAGRMDAETEQLLSARMLSIAWLALTNGYMDIAHGAVDSSRVMRHAGNLNRSVALCTGVARMPAWCAPTAARWVRRLARV
jgi:glycosyltransferase involved in cell wall biosynthesis